jgi:hypothetical protein
LETLVVAQNVLRSLRPNVVSSEEDVEAANALYAWLARISLPSAEFANSLVAAYTDNGAMIDILTLLNFLPRKLEY